MKLISFDLDDTLLADDLSISDYTVEILQRLQNDGHIIVPASGRAKDSMTPFVDRISCASYCISCNGAEIWDIHNNALLSSVTFSPETGRRIAAFARDHGLYAQTYAGDSFFYSQEGKYAEMYAASSLLNGVYVGDLTVFINEPRSKILMMDDAEKIAALLPEAADQFAGEACVTCSKPYFLEFNPPDATKGKAISRICNMIGITMNDVICFGDSLNDLSMLTSAGLGIAVANARDDVKSLCMDICDTNNNNGVAKYLESLFYQQEKMK